MGKNLVNSKNFDDFISNSSYSSFEVATTNEVENLHCFFVFG